MIVSDKMKWTFLHGLGDTVSLSIVLKHIDAYKPDWSISIETHDCFKCLLPEKYLIDNGATPREMHYQETREHWLNYPATKPAKLLKLLHINPDWRLWEYTVPKLTSPVDVPNTPYILIHPVGVHCKKQKDFTPDETEALVDCVKEAGFLPIVLGDDIIPQDIPDLYKLIENSQAIIGCDSGPVHLSLALKKPTIVFWKGHWPEFCIDPSLYLFNYTIPTRRKQDDAYWVDMLTPFQFRKTLLLEVIGACERERLNAHSM